ncbi:MAG: serine--tRNA ligase [Deltaproteobacteria bacterium]|nr:serine--tRNA ligase [Deltaproteobacteria bacterium]
MLDFRQVGADLEGHRRRLTRRPGFDPALLDRVGSLFAERTRVIQETQRLQEQRNVLNKRMQDVMKSGTPEEKQAARDEGRAISERTKELEAKTKEVEDALEALMLDIPNAPHDSVPSGKSADDNQVVRVWGQKPEYGFKPRDHVAIGEGLGMLDFARAAKISASRFVVEYDALARLERALTSFMLDTHTSEHGYREVAVPYLVNRTAMTGTAQLPKFEADLFKVPFTENNDLFLIPTAEVPVTNLYNDEILTPDDGALPHAYACYTACFRSEAGAAGKDTRGMIRMHQFNKVELVRFVDPETSYDELEKLVGHASKILEKLGLHHRVVLLCTGDMSANATKCYDLEVWLPGQDAFREISSCSNFGDFQARRAKIRFKKDKQGKAQLVHTLNGSGLAVGRTLIAIVEQYQDQDGSVRIPEALRPYMGGLDRITPTQR